MADDRELNLNINATDNTGQAINNLAQRLVSLKTPVDGLETSFANLSATMQATLAKALGFSDNVLAAARKMVAGQNAANEALTQSFINVTSKIVDSAEKQAQAQALAASQSIVSINRVKDAVVEAEARKKAALLSTAEAGLAALAEQQQLMELEVIGTRVAAEQAAAREKILYGTATGDSSLILRIQQNSALYISEIEARKRKEAEALQQSVRVKIYSPTPVPYTGDTKKDLEASTVALQAQRNINRFLIQQEEERNKQAEKALKLLKQQEEEEAKLAGKPLKERLSSAATHIVPIGDEVIRGQSRQALASVGSAMRALGLSTTALLTSFGALLALMAGGAVLEAAKNMGKWAEETRAAVSAAGISIEKFSAIQGTLGLMGLKTKEANIALVQFAKSFETAVSDSASKAALAFGQFNITQDDLKAHIGDTAGLLQLFIQRWNEYSDSEAKTQAGSEIFKRSLEQIAPLLNLTTDELQNLMEQSKKTGNTLTQETAKSLIDTQRAVIELGNEILGKGRQAFIEWAPAIKAVVELLGEVAKVAGAIITAPVAVAASVAKVVEAQSSTKYTGPKAGSPEFNRLPARTQTMYANEEARARENLLSTLNLKLPEAPIAPKPGAITRQGNKASAEFEVEQRIYNQRVKELKDKQQALASEFAPKAEAVTPKKTMADVNYSGQPTTMEELNVQIGQARAAMAILAKNTGNLNHATEMQEKAELQVMQKALAKENTEHPGSKFGVELAAREANKEAELATAELHSATKDKTDALRVQTKDQEETWKAIKTQLGYEGLVIEQEVQARNNQLIAINESAEAVRQSLKGDSALDKLQGLGGPKKSYDALASESRDVVAKGLSEINNLQAIVNNQNNDIKVRQAAVEQIEKTITFVGDKVSSLYNQAGDAAANSVDVFKTAWKETFNTVDSDIDKLVGDLVKFGTGGNKLKKAFHSIVLGLGAEFTSSITKGLSSLAAGGVANLLKTSLEPGQGFGALIGKAFGSTSKGLDFGLTSENLTKLATASGIAAQALGRLGGGTNVSSPGSSSASNSTVTSPGGLGSGGSPAASNDNTQATKQAATNLLSLSSAGQQVVQGMNVLNSAQILLTGVTAAHTPVVAADAAATAVHTPSVLADAGAFIVHLANIAVDDIALAYHSVLEFLSLEGGGIVPSAMGGMVVPSAAGGMVVGGVNRGGGIMSILHPREMVLPAKLSQGVQNMINYGSGFTGGGTTHNHNFNPTLNISSHGKMSADEISDFGDAIMSHLRNAKRNGNYP